jgi:hypothetical protein
MTVAPSDSKNAAICSCAITAMLFITALSVRIMNECGFLKAAARGNRSCRYTVTCGASDPPRMVSMVFRVHDGLVAARQLEQIGARWNAGERLEPEVGRERAWRARAIQPFQVLQEILEGNRSLDVVGDWIGAGLGIRAGSARFSLKKGGVTFNPPRTVTPATPGGLSSGGSRAERKSPTAPRLIGEKLRRRPSFSIAFRSFWLTTLVSEGVIASPYRTHVRPRRSLAAASPAFLTSQGRCEVCPSVHLTG